MLVFLLELFKFILAWFLMCATLLAALLAECVYAFISGGARGRRGLLGVALYMRRIFAPFSAKILLPHTSSPWLAIYMPGLALAALMPVCASIPFCTLIPVLDNGGDILQIMQFALLSETLAIVAVFSLGTAGGDTTGHRMINETMALMLPFAACFASLASYFASIGITGDTFSLNSFTLFIHISSIGTCGHIAIAMFVFAIFSRISHSDTDFSCSLLEDGELPEYQGCPRGVLQLWSIFRSLLIIAVVTHVFFPWKFFNGLNSGFSVSWWAQSVTFFAFWLTVILVRAFLVSLCWRITATIESALPKKAAFLFIPALTLIAVLLVVYETIKVSMEAAAF